MSVCPVRDAPNKDSDHRTLPPAAPIGESTACMGRSTTMSGEAYLRGQMTWVVAHRCAAAGGALVGTAGRIRTYPARDRVGATTINWDRRTQLPDGAPPPRGP